MIFIAKINPMRPLNHNNNYLPQKFYNNIKQTKTHLLIILIQMKIHSKTTIKTLKIIMINYQTLIIMNITHNKIQEPMLVASTKESKIIN